KDKGQKRPKGPKGPKGHKFRKPRTPNPELHFFAFFLEISLTNSHLLSRMAPATLLATLIAEHILKLILSANSDFSGGKNFPVVAGEKTLPLS
ncbi:MAG TPA: hypothetical protein PLB32_02340, partial [Acidobacteriota bacterium]|nr:hypothetical protein [Acidobacteriota bacterium]